MDGGAWQATVHSVAKSWTRLSDFTLYGVREFSDFILLLIADQFSQHHYQRDYLFSFVFLPPLSKIRCSEVHGFVWAFYLVPLVYISGFVPVQFWCDDCSFVIRHTLKLILVINIFIRSIMLFISCNLSERIESNISIHVIKSNF